MRQTGVVTLGNEIKKLRSRVRELENIVLKHNCSTCVHLMGDICTDVNGNGKAARIFKPEDSCCSNWLEVK